MMAGEHQLAADDGQIDRLLAAVLRGETPAWPSDWPFAPVVERILYHGIAGLVAERMRDLDDWPAALTAPVRDQAVAQAMWEMRHKPLLANLLAVFAEDGIKALLLKGSAVAYDLYPAPAARSRGDTDLLIASSDLERARLVLKRLSFERSPDDEMAEHDFSLQEVWSARDHGETSHDIDLHWQLLNSPALRGVMEFDACAADQVALPRLGPDAVTMSRVNTLLHTCIHRAMHITTPYFVDGITYYGGDRLIWANDINLLAAALSADEWDQLAVFALHQGVAGAAINGLEMARRTLGTQVPARVLERLGESSDETASTYLIGLGQMRRSLADFLAVGGWRRKLAYASKRVFPSPRFMRAKYPDMKDRPMAALYGRRVIDLVRARPGRSNHK